jgi:hypothetical protein
MVAVAAVIVKTAVSVISGHQEAVEKLNNPG